MKKTIFALLIITLVCKGCRSEEPVPASSIRLPEITTNGAGTLGCLIDDKPWQNAGFRKHQDQNLFSEFIYDSQRDSTRIYISGYMFTNADNNHLNLVFWYKGFPKTGEVYTVGVTPKLSFYVSYSPTLKITSDVVSHQAAYSTANLINSANISFTKVDTIAKILSGTFYSKLYPDSNPITTPSKTLTQGRFDVRFQ